TRGDGLARWGWGPSPHRFRHHNVGPAAKYAGAPGSSLARRKNPVAMSAPRAHGHRPFTDRKLFSGEVVGGHRLEHELGHPHRILRTTASDDQRRERQI